MTVYVPATVAEVAEIISQASASGRKIEVRGGGSKSDIGIPERDATVLQTTSLAGVIDYDPSELVMTVWAGTRLEVIEQLVAERDQMLAFEPFDHGPIFGRESGAATIGGVLAAAVSGSSRVTAGAARDHLLGFEAVSGRAQRFVAGAKVVKNVTGYDVPKLMVGSWGRCAVLTQVTLKALPRPKVRTTLLVEGLSTAQAYEAMARAMASQAAVTAVAHLPRGLGRALAMTAFRIQGFGPSVSVRCSMLQKLLGNETGARVMECQEAVALWSVVRNASVVRSDRPLWRIHVPPSRASRVVSALELQPDSWCCDWAGGLVWAASDADSTRVRSVTESAGGHAALVRAPPAVRACVPAHHPDAAGVAALSRRIRRAFDPAGVFETGRFLDDADAN